MSAEWFDARDETGQRGLRFRCSMCGQCCTGRPGYVRFTDEEGRKIAARLAVDHDRFLADYTHDSIVGRSLNERPSPHGLDCVFLDRESVPGKAVCGIYEDRPAQCRTWPFWESNLRSIDHWRQAARRCPGIGKGQLVRPDEIRILRAQVRI